MAKAEQFKKNDPRINKNGRPVGQRNYATIYREALRQIGENQGKTPEEMEELLEKAGISQALKGNYQFWRDIRDRIHGQPRERKEIEVTLPKPIYGALSGHNSDKENIQPQEED